MRWAACAAVLALFAKPAAAIETAGEVYVNIDASTFATGNTTWTNTGSYGNFTASGTPRKITIGNAPAVAFDGQSAFVGSTAAPAGLTGLKPTRTIEAWVFNPIIQSEETIVAWGHRGGAEGTNMAFNYGNHQLYGAVGHWGGDHHDLGWIGNPQTGEAEVGAPEAGKWHLLTYTFDGSTTRVYSDGVLANEENIEQDWVETNGLPSIDTFPDDPIAIASQWNNVDPSLLNGGLKGILGINRMRIHDGVLTDAQIAANYNSEKGLFTNPVVVPPPAPNPDPIPAGPVHRYSFSNPVSANATDAVLTDSVGGANGVVRGDGASFTGTGLKLVGGSSAEAAYADLPNGIISSLTDVSIETWMTIDGTQNWARVFDFGSTTPGGDEGELDSPGGGGEGLDYMALTASRGTEVDNHRFEWRDADGANGNGTVTLDFTEVKTLPFKAHYTVVYDHDGESLVGTPTITVYKDGEKVGESETSAKLSDINDVNNWLGRSNWTGDSNTEGTYDEFRIYDYALTNNQVRGNFAAGPDKVNIGGGKKGDFDGDGDLDAADINALSAAVKAGSNDTKFDVDGNGQVSDDDRGNWVRVQRKTYFGDANLDGEFNSGDLVDMFQVGEYEDGVAGNSGWSDGDFSGDGDFDTGDLVTAFQDGGFENGPRAAVSAIPEPSSMVLVATGLLGLLGRRRRR